MSVKSTDPRVEPTGRARLMGPREAGAYLPIADYALIGNCLTAALVSLDGSIDWACFPRFDSPSVFARLLDADRGGFWQIAPAGGFTASRAYLPDTNVLRTQFVTATGEAEVLDFMPAVGTVADRHPEGTIVRLVRGLRGTVPLECRCDPRFDYGRAAARWSIDAAGARIAVVDASLSLQTDFDLSLPDGCLDGRLTIEAGRESVSFLSFSRTPSLVWRSDPAADGTRLLDATVAFWRDWIGRCAYAGPYVAHVRRSALVLKLLDYSRTGAIIAAPTTSLPEEIGGVRNWDYRYSWLRDTAFTLYALFSLGYREEGEAFLDWILSTTGSNPTRLQVLYGIEGEHRIDEFELAHLEGYRGSRPVRIGNAAYSQRQHDIYGEIVDCAFLLFKQGATLSTDLWRFLHDTVEHVRRVWREPDQGIWEVRSGPSHFVYSKALCWVALDRGIKLAERAGLPADLAAWRAARREIFDEIVGKGYDPDQRAFTQAYGTRELDASALALLLRKVVPPDDDRIQTTVDQLVRQLGDGIFLHRYRPVVDDGLPGGEGAFLMCSFWLVDSYALLGRIDEARTLFDGILEHANDVGLFAEEIDPASGHHLGNFPQAFTHIALINAAVCLAEASSNSDR